MSAPPDPLAQATAALRAQAGGNADGPRSDADPAATWARVIADVRQRRRRGRIAMVAAMQLLLAGLGVAAWAGTTHRLPMWVAAGERWIASVSADMRSRAAKGPRPATSPLHKPIASAAAPAPSPESSVRLQTEAPAPPVVSRTGTPTRVAVVRQRPPRRDHNVVPEVTPAPEPAATVSPDDVYRRAHQAHFGERDYARALSYWDSYLKLGVQRFTPEARYNRAIALAHLGRFAEAAMQLQPFAEGDYGTYRQAEAQALLARLRRSTP